MFDHGDLLFKYSRKNILILQDMNIRRIDEDYKLHLEVYEDFFWQVMKFIGMLPIGGGQK
jgi:hypothetical protein